MVPFFHGGFLIGRAEDRDELVLEGSDESLCCIATVHAGRDQLVVNTFLIKEVLYAWLCLVFKPYI